MFITRCFNSVTILEIERSHGKNYVEVCSQAGGLFSISSSHKEIKMEHFNDV